MSRIMVYTQAYNMGKVLRRAVDSVLNQTFDDFIYYLVDDGSVDETGEIVREYAAQDKRIIPIFNETNQGERTFFDLIQDSSINGECYLCTLDGNGEYSSDFLYSMIRFMDENVLDVASCENDFVGDIDEGKEMYLQESIEKNIVLQGELFADCFPAYYQRIKTKSGKLYKMSLIRKCNFDNIREWVYGSEAFFVLEVLCQTDRFGILAESLARTYAIQNESSSKNFHEERVVCEQKVYEKTLEFLRIKGGGVSELGISEVGISELNKDFLYCAYLCDIKETVETVIGSNIATTRKLKQLHDIFTYEYTRRLASRPGPGLALDVDMSFGKTKIFLIVSKWIVSQRESRLDNDFALVSDIISAMRVLPYDYPGWRDDEKFVLLLAIREKLSAQSASLRTVDMQLKRHFALFPVLRDLPVDQSGYFRQVVEALINNDRFKALNILSDILDKDNVPSEYRESFIRLGQNVCALAEHADGWVLFKIMWVEFLISQSRRDEANTELNELEEMFPDAGELKALRAKF